MFILFGLSAPWHDWLALEWTAWLFVLAVLLLRRPPVWLLLRPLLRSLQHRREALFNGWFGPIGIAALFYAAEASHMTHIDRIWTIASLVVFASILLHGMSATPLIRRFGGLIALRPAGQDGRSRALSAEIPTHAMAWSEDGLRPGNPPQLTISFSRSISVPRRPSLGSPVTGQPIFCRTCLIAAPARGSSTPPSGPAP